MTIWILAAVAVFFVQAALPSMFRYVLGSDPQVFALFGPRDVVPDGGVLAARADRALRNSFEAMVVFLPLALLAPESSLALFGAQIFVLARVAYVPAYLSGIPYLRSSIWLVGVMGLAVMAHQVLMQAA